MIVHLSILFANENQKFLATISKNFKLFLNFLQSYFFRYIKNADNDYDRNIVRYKMHEIAYWMIRYPDVEHILYKLFIREQIKAFQILFQ